MNYNIINMFDNSISVISSISKSLKKYLFILGIITQSLFVTYYVYLVVTNVENVHLLILYSSLLTFASFLLFVDIFTVDTTSFKTKIVKTNIKRVLNVFSWLCKGAVIGYNIYITISKGATEAGKMFLIFSSIFLIIQVISSLFIWLISYYSELLLFAVKMDYENIIDENADPNEKPIGKTLNKLTSQKDHRDKINELAIKRELYGSIKDELEKDGMVNFAGTVVRRKKAERIIHSYYAKASRYYLSKNKIKELIHEINNNHLDYVLSNDEAFLLDFFLMNHYENIYVGISEHAVKLIIGCFLFILDGNSKEIIPVVYKALTKEIIDIKTWSKMKEEAKSTPSSNIIKVKFDRAVSIAKKTKTQYELYKEETVGSELEALLFKTVKDSVIESGKNSLRRKFRSFFGRDKKD